MQSEDEGQRSELAMFCASTGLDLVTSLEVLGGLRISVPVEFVELENEFLDGWQPGARPWKAAQQLVIGDPGEVVLTMLGDGAIETAEFAVTWYGPHTPVSYRRLATRCTVFDRGDLTEQTLAAVARLRADRLSRYLRCSRCRNLTPPEWWHGEGHCQSCAEQYLGVVH